MLSEKDAQNLADMENLRQQLAKLIKENEKKEASPSEEKNEVNCVLWRTGCGHGCSWQLISDCFVLAGSLCVCSGGRPDQGSGGEDTAGGEEYPTVTAALRPQRESEHLATDILVNLTLTS